MQMLLWLIYTFFVFTVDELVNYGAMLVLYYDETPREGLTSAAKSLEMQLTLPAKCVKG